MGFLLEEISNELPVVSCSFEAELLFFTFIDSCWLLPARIKGTLVFESTWRNKKIAHQSAT
jgi:hypothetical protein